MARESVEGQMGEEAHLLAARQALSRVRPNGLRQRDLARLRIAIWPDYLSRSDYVSRLKTAAYLRRTCRQMRQLGLTNPCRYDLALHSARLENYRMEVRELAILNLRRRSSPMSLEAARHSFLNLMGNAQWTENVASDMTHTFTVTERDLAILADALGLDHRIYETMQACIRRHLTAHNKQAAE